MTEDDQAKPKRTFLLKKRLKEDIEHSRQLDMRSGLSHYTGLPSKNLTSVMQKFRTVGQSLSSLTEQPQRKEGVASAKSSRRDSEIDIASEVQGPSLVADKVHLSFVEITGRIANDSLTISNNGTTAIYYKWKRVDLPGTFATSIADREERFFCHYNKNVIKPGEKKSFYFSFKSRTTGIFSETWTLDCEPTLVTPLPKFQLSGNAIEDDTRVKWRGEIDSLIYENSVERGMKEIVDDIVGDVRTPTPPLPDLNDPAICKREFEEKNAHHKFYYTPIVVDLWHNLREEIFQENYLNIAEYYWDLNVDHVAEIIQDVKDDLRKGCFERRYRDIYRLSRVRPLERSPIFAFVKEKLSRIALEFEDLANANRNAKELLEVKFVEPQFMTPEEEAKKREEDAKQKPELYKKAKKKAPKSDEEERKLIEDYKGELTKKLIGTMQEHLEKLSKSDQYITADHTLKTRTKPPGKDYFEFLWRRKSIRDLAFDNKKVLLRIHLKQKDPALLKKETKVEAPVVEEEKKEDPKAKGGKDTGKDSKKDAKQAAAQPAKGRTAAGRKGKKEEEKAEEPAGKKIDPISLIDEKSLEDALRIIKFSLDMLAKLVVVVVSYGDTFGQPKEGNSARVLYDWMAGKLDQPVIFLDSARYERDADDNFIFDSYGDNTVVILENLFFYPEEAGYQFDPKTEILQKTDPANIEEYTHMLSQYCNFYVIDDKYNFFKNYNSITDVKTEQNVLGLSMCDDVLILAQTFLQAMYRPQPSKRERRRLKKLGQQISKEHKLAIALIGGDLSGEYLLALDTIVEHYDVLYFLGRVGVLVFMFFAKIEKIGDIVMDPFKKALLERLLNRCKELGKRFEFPIRFELSERPNPELPEAAQLEKILKTRICYPFKAVDPRELEAKLEKQAAEIAAKEEKKEEEKKAGGGKQDAKADKKDDPKKPRQPSATAKKDSKKAGKEPEKPVQEESPEVGFNEKWIVTEIAGLQKFKTDLDNSRNVLWLGNLSPFKHPDLNSSTKYYANLLYEKHQDRNKQQLNGIPNDDFLSTVIGKDLEETLNYFQFEQELAKLEKKKKKRSRKSEDQEGEENPEEEGNPEEEEVPNDPEEGEGDDEEEDENGEKKKKKKLDNIDLITSVYINLRFFSTNEEFLVKLMSGKYCKVLDNIDSWPKRSDSDDDGVDLGDDV